MTLKVSTLCAAGKTLDDLKVGLAGLPGLSITPHSGDVSVLATVLQKEHPDLLFLNFPMHDDNAMKQLEAALLGRHDTWLVLLSPDRSADFLMTAMRAGVREVLSLPLDAAQVQQAVKRVQTHHVNSVRGRHKSGRVLAMIPSKGGAGATFIATNLAYALSRQGKRVAVLDLNMYFGDAAIYLGDSAATSNVVELAAKSKQMDATLLESSMIRVSNDLFVLAAPASPDHVRDVSVSDIQKIIELARASYDFVILDIGYTLDPLTIKALDIADTIYLALQLNLPFVRAAKRMVNVFRDLGYASDKLHIVVNREEKGGDIGLHDVEKTCNLKVAMTLPNSHAAVSASINQGRALLALMPKDPVARGLQAWAEQLAPSVRQKTSSSWFSNWRS